jgi:hypothetical protein
MRYPPGDKMAFTRLRKFLLPALAGLALMTGPSWAEPAPFPDELKTEGLLVFEMARHPVAGLGPMIWIQDAEISGKRYRGLLRSGNLFAVVLPPGEHVLESLHGQSPNRGSSHFGGVTVYSKPSAQWEANRNFTIEAGKVTNLGGLLFMENDADPRRFRLAYIDSSKAPPSLWAANPKLAAALGSDKFSMAPGVYASPVQLNAVRTELLEAKFKTMTPAAIEHSNFVASDAGSLALLVKGDGKPASLKLVDPGTFRFDKCRNWSTGAACYLNDNGVLIIDDKSKTEVRYPRDFKPTDYLVFGERGIVLVDGRFRILMSRNAGQNWALDESIKLEKETFALRPLLRNGAKGFYVHSKYLFGKPEVKRLLYSPYEKLELRPIEMPEEVEKIDIFLESDRGLYVAFTTTKNTAPLYFQANGKTEWEKRATIPGGGCLHLFADRKDSNRLTAICSSQTKSEAKEYLSDDDGLSWREGVQTAP